MKGGREDIDFGAETQGFQAPVDRNDRGKAEIPRKITVMKETFATSDPNDLFFGFMPRIKRPPFFLKK